MLNTRSERPARGEETRQRILAASLALVSTRGVDGLSIRAVAKRARVSVGLAHYHFGDRRALVRAALEASRATFLAKATAEPPTGDGALPLRKTLQLVRALVDFMPGWYRVVAELDAMGLRDRGFRGEAARHRAQGETDVLAYLALALGRGPDAAGELRPVASVLLAAFDGLAVRKLLDPAFDLDAAHLAIEKLLVTTLLPGTRIPEAPWDDDALKAKKPKRTRRTSP